MRELSALDVKVVATGTNGVREVLARCQEMVVMSDVRSAPAAVPRTFEVPAAFLVTVSTRRFERFGSTWSHGR
jgi:hypothetical protein